MTIKVGSRGAEVQTLQLQLKALGYSPGDIDGVFGPHTQAALKRFQTDYETLAPTGELDPQTKGAIEQALVQKPTQSAGGTDATVSPAPCEPETWAAFMDLVKVVTTTPVQYGPGRGLFVDGHWTITQGAGGLNRTKWSSATGTTYPSFHCTSWTNFFLGWLLRYNERFTHAGNIPSLFTLCEAPDDLLAADDGEKFRGYGPHCRPIHTDGSTYPRQSFANTTDIRELYDRRKTLPTFMVMGQSTRTGATWKTWHHTVVFVVDHSAPDHPMYRIAADGYRAANGAYSAKPMAWKTIDEHSIPEYLHTCTYRGYGVVSADGTYAGTGPRPPVVAELTARAEQHSEHGPGDHAGE